MTDTARLVELIETTLARAGSGESGDSPMRVITQYWTLQGDLVAEIDPCATPFTPERRQALEDALFAELGDTLHEGQQGKELWAALSKVLDKPQ